MKDKRNIIFRPRYNPNRISHDYVNDTRVVVRFDFSTGESKEYPNAYYAAEDIVYSSFYVNKCCMDNKSAGALKYKAKGYYFIYKEDLNEEMVNEFRKLNSKVL